MNKQYDYNKRKIIIYKKLLKWNVCSSINNKIEAHNLDKSIECSKSYNGIQWTYILNKKFIKQTYTVLRNLQSCIFGIINGREFCWIKNSKRADRGEFRVNETYLLYLLKQ